MGQEVGMAEMEGVDQVADLEEAGVEVGSVRGDEREARTQVNPTST